MTKHRVLLVDDQPIYRAGLKALMQTHPALAYVAEAASAAEALTQLQSGDFSVLVTDLQLAQDSGLDLIGRSMEQAYAMKVVVLSTSKAAEDVVIAIRMGVSAYLPRGVSARELLQALDDVLSGRAYLHSESAELLFRQMREEAFSNSMLVPEATAQEKEIVSLMCKGKSIQEISQILYLSNATIKTHMRSLYQKWGVNSRTKLIARARELHLNEL
ncbi:MAG: response regulator transcription factor [Candidatus Eremiobacteraeota bacterium]|nr:response regulator transcription factor [Candidatus Eremiobacteraeota bacterium]